MNDDRLYNSILDSDDRVHERIDYNTKITSAINKFLSSPLFETFAKLPERLYCTCSVTYRDSNQPFTGWTSKILPTYTLCINGASFENIRELLYKLIIKAVDHEFLTNDSYNIKLTF